jgi:hypothetical protein
MRPNRSFDTDAGGRALACSPPVTSFVSRQEAKFGRRRAMGVDETIGLLCSALEGSTMSRSRTESCTIEFDCKLGQTNVLIMREYKILVGANGEELARAVYSTRCNHMTACPIATHHDNSTSMDWSRCSFVNAEKAAS